MGHDHHFLSRLDRASGDHVDLALGLYRDHEAVRFILDRLKLRPGQERVALALGPLDRGPYVVLQTNGHFVTCLGEGMSTGGLDIVPRERVDELLAKHREGKGRESALEVEQRKDENRREFFGRLFRRANMLSREEFTALASFAPIMGTTFFWMSVDASKYIVDNCAHFYGVQKVSPKDRDLARSIYEAVWNAGHFILLAALEREEFERLRDVPGRLNMATHLATFGNATSMLKAVWAGSQLGKMGFARYEASLDPELPQTNVLEAVMTLVVMALRDKTLVVGVTRALEKLDAAYGPIEDAPEGENAMNLAAAGLEILRNADDYLTNAVLMGKGLFHLFGKKLPEGDPLRYDDMTAVPEDLAATTLLSLEAPLYEPNTLSLVMSATPLVAMAKAEDFYFTREVGRAVLTEWEPEQTLRTIGRFAVDMSQKPRRVEQKVGRNDPCPCGSGKKYKKCHGAN